MALGITAAIGALGLFLMPAFNAISIALTGNVGAALITFIGFGLSCLGVT